MLLQTALIAAALVGLFCIFLYGMRFVRRRNDRRAEQMDFNFSLDELHRLRTEGKLTGEEFERAKSVILIRCAARAQEPGLKRGFEVLPPQDKEHPRA